MKRTQNRWVVRAQVGAIAIFLLSVLVVMGYPVRSMLIRRAEMPVFKSLEQDLNGFDTSGAINSAIPVPASKADWILLQPYYLSDDMSHHPELVGVVPQYVAEHLMWKNTVEMPLLIGVRDGVLIDAAHINGEYQLSGVLIFRHGDLLSLDRTSGVIQVSVTRQSK